MSLSSSPQLYSSRICRVLQVRARPLALNLGSIINQKSSIKNLSVGCPSLSCSLRKLRMSACRTFNDPGINPRVFPFLGRPPRLDFNHSIFSCGHSAENCSRPAGQVDPPLIVSHRTEQLSSPVTEAGSTLIPPACNSHEALNPGRVCHSLAPTWNRMA
jgi:hypothetical protein